MHQTKDIDWLNEYKIKTHIYTVYKRTTSDQGTDKHWKLGEGEKYSMQVEAKRKLEWYYSYQTKYTLKYRLF